VLPVRRGAAAQAVLAAGACSMPAVAGHEAGARRLDALEAPVGRLAAALERLATRLEEAARVQSKAVALAELSHALAEGAAAATPATRPAPRDY
jgi:hypothetical protein